MKRTQGTSAPILAGIFLALTGLFVIALVFVIRLQAQDAPSTILEITNSPPSVDTVKLCSGHGASPTLCSHVTVSVGVTLTAGTTAPYQIVGTLSDPNGFTDLTTFRGSLYNTSVTSATCDSAAEASSDGGANCYYGDNSAGCTLVSTSATAGYFDCNLSMQYFATATNASADPVEQGDPSDTWTVQGYVEDNGGGSDTLTAVTEVNSLRAIGSTTGNTCAAINYGSLANGAATVDSGDPGTDCVLTNDGNVDTDVSERGGHMFCSFGGIETGNQRVNTTSGSYAQMSVGGIDLTSSSQTIDLSLDKSANGAVVQDSIFHAITVPALGASGSCSGTNTIIAIAEL